MALVITGVTVVAAIYAHKKAIFDLYNDAVEDDVVDFDGTKNPGSWLVASAADSTKALVVTDMNAIPAGVPVINTGSAAKRSGDVTVTDIKNINYDDILKAFMLDLNSADMSAIDDYDATGTNPYWQYLAIGSETFVVPIYGTTERPLRVRIWQRIEYEYTDEATPSAYEFVGFKEVWLNGCSDMPINSEVTLSASQMNGYMADDSFNPIDPITDITAIAYIEGSVRFWGNSNDAVNDLAGGTDRFSHCGVICESAGGRDYYDTYGGIFQILATSTLITDDTNITFRHGTSGLYDKDYLHYHVVAWLSQLYSGDYPSLPLAVGGYVTSSFQPCALFREAIAVSTSDGSITYGYVAVPIGAKVTYTPGTGGTVYPLCKSIIMYNKIDTAGYNTKQLPIYIDTGTESIRFEAGGVSAYIPAGTTVKAWIGGRWVTRQTIDDTINLGANASTLTYIAGTNTVYRMPMEHLSAWQIAEIFGMSDITADTPVRIPIQIMLSYAISGGPTTSSGFTAYMYIAMGSLIAATYISHIEPVGQRNKITNLKFRLRTNIYDHADVASGDFTDEVSRHATIMTQTGSYAFAKIDARITQEDGEFYIEETFERVADLPAVTGANTVTLKVNDWLLTQNYSQRAIAFTYSGGSALTLTPMYPFNVDNNFASKTEVTYTET